MEILIPIAFFGMIVGLTWIPHYYKSRERDRTHQTLRAMIEQGQPVSPDLLSSLQTKVAAVQSPDGDLRRGVIWLAVGLALYAMSWVLGPLAGEEASWGVAACATIPGFVGAGFLLLWFLNRKRKA